MKKFKLLSYCLFILLSAFGCYNKKSEQVINAKVSLINPIDTSSKPVLYIGGSDSSFLFEAEISDADKDYPGAIKIVFTSIIDTATHYLAYYKIEPSIDSSLLSKLQITPFPGDRTLKLSYLGKEFVAYNIIEDVDLRSEFNGILMRRTPLIGHNESKIKVVNGDVEIGFEKLSGNKMSVVIIRDGKIQETQFVLLQNSIRLDEVIVSHYDEVDKRIYYYENDALRFMSQEKI